MDEFQKHVLKRLTDVEEELRDLRAVTWPVCQAQLDQGNSMKNISQKKSLLKWLDLEEVTRLLRLKGRIMGLTRDQVACELREILVVERREDTA